jgi:uncharacterized phiE125 gp8 family phage protein
LGPAELPITLADARAQCRVTSTSEDARLLAMIYAATEWGENLTARRLITQTWDLYLDAFPCDEIRAPYAPLRSVTSISYVDLAGVTQTLATSEYVGRCEERARAHRAGLQQGFPVHL